jgi:hypothetical protein
MMQTLTVPVDVLTQRLMIVNTETQSSGMSAAARATLPRGENTVSAVSMARMIFREGGVRAFYR